LRLEGWGVFGGGKDGQPAGWGEEIDGHGDGRFHFVDGTEGDAVEFLTQGFSAAAVDFCIQTEGADGFAKEGGFFVLGFGEGYR
jgi:hypothetical protein